MKITDLPTTTTIWFVVDNSGTIIAQTKSRSEARQVRSTLNQKVSIYKSNVVHESPVRALKA